ncbi:Pentatricopeptide repeat-containing protein, partial [Musa troglodytarum]
MGSKGGVAPPPSVVCCMCGDHGLAQELFRCKVCLVRCQHNDLYPKAQSYGACNWCLREEGAKSLAKEAVKDPNTSVSSSTNNDVGNGSSGSGGVELHHRVFSSHLHKPIKRPKLLNRSASDVTDRSRSGELSPGSRRARQAFRGKVQRWLHGSVTPVISSINLHPVASKYEFSALICFAIIAVEFSSAAEFFRDPSIKLSGTGTHCLLQQSSTATYKRNRWLPGGSRLSSRSSLGRELGGSKLLSLGSVAVLRCVLRCHSEGKGASRSRSVTSSSSFTSLGSLVPSLSSPSLRFLFLEKKSWRSGHVLLSSGERAACSDSDTMEFEPKQHFSCRSA